MIQYADQKTMKRLYKRACEYREMFQSVDQETYGFVNICIKDQNYPVMLWPNSLFYFIGEDWQKYSQIFILSTFFSASPEFLLGATRSIDFDFDADEENAFISFRPGLFGDELTQEEAELMLKVFDCLLDIFEVLVSFNIFEEQSITDIITCTYVEDEDQWYYKVEPFEPEQNAYEDLEVDDGVYRKQLLNAKRTDLELGVDANFFCVEVYDDAYDQPIDPLLFTCFDLKTDEILAADVMQPADDWQEVIFLNFVGMILEHGIPKRVYIRNLMVFHTIRSVCDLLDIEIVKDDLEEADDLLAFVVDQYLSEEWLEE